MSTASFPHPQSRYIIYRLPCDLAGVFYRYRKSFELPAVPHEKVFLRITGFYLYQVFLNGAFVGRGPLQAGKLTTTVDVFDVTSLLRPGHNVLAVHLLAGNYQAQRLEPAAWIGSGILADLSTQSGQVLAATDESWRCDLDRAYQLGSPRRSMWSSLFEHYDARRDEPAWREAGFDDRAWPLARVRAPRIPYIAEYELWTGPGYEYETDERFTLAAAGRVRFTKDPLEHYWFDDASVYEAVADRLEGVTDRLRPGERMKAVTIAADETEARFFRVVADEYVLGRPFFELEAPAGLTIDVVWSERKVNPEPLLSPFTRMGNWMRYVTREGRQRFTFFDVHGFREMQFTLQPGAGTVRFLRLGAERQWTMRCDKGAFRASDERYEQLWKAGARTVACITTEHHSDNSFREQAAWSGDQEWTKMAAYVAEGVHPITERQFRQMLKGQLNDGRLVSPYPHGFPFLRQFDAQKQSDTGADLPDHSLGFILSLWRHYWYSGNLALLQEAWPHLQRQVAYFDTVCNERGLLDLHKITESWIWVDWKGLKDRSAPLNALWGAALATMVQIARTLKESPAPYQRRLRRFKTAFAEAFWDAPRNLFVDRPLRRPALGENLSQLTQAVAVCYDLLPESADSARLAADLTALDGRLGVTTPPMQGFVLAALEKLGADERLHDLLARQWLFPETLDGGTLPEFWAGQGNVLQSQCQGGGPMISWALTYYVLGIRPRRPGFAKVEIRPSPGPLAFAAGQCPTPHGDIHVEWRRRDTVLEIAVEGPAECVKSGRRRISVASPSNTRKGPP